MFMDTRLDGQRAVVTAGAGGLGLVIATALSAEGADVFVCDIDGPALEALPGHLEGAWVDVSDAGAVAAWLDPIGRVSSGRSPIRWTRATGRRTRST